MFHHISSVTPIPFNRTSNCLIIYVMLTGFESTAVRFKCTVSVTEEKRSLGHPGITGRIAFKWILQETGCEDVNWIHLAQDRVQW
jgi:hypothetical protein